MPIPEILQGRLRLPVVGAPMFIVSTPRLVLAQCKAGIIGSLPPVVMALVWLTTPDYIALLWTHQTGQLMLVACLTWMTIGILVMKKMINFDF